MAAGADFRSRITVDTTQATAAVKDLGATGEQSFNKIDKGTKTATQSLKSFTKETTGMRRATGQLFKQFGDVGRSLESVGGLLGSVFGGVAGGVIGVGIGKAISGIISSLDGVSERLEKIKKQAQEIAVKPTTFQAAQEIAGAAGQGPDVGAKIMAQTADVIAKAAVEAKKAGAEGVTVLRGMGDEAGKTAKAVEEVATASGRVVTIMRGGGVKEEGDFVERSLAKINDRIKNFKDTADGTLQKQKAIWQGFLDIAKTVDPTSQKLNEFSKRLLGVTAPEALKTLPALISQIDAKIKELNQSERGATEPKLSAAERLAAARAVQQTMFEEQTAAISNWYIRLDAAVTEAENRFITETLPRWSAGFTGFFSNSFAPTMESAWSSFIADLNQLWVAQNWATLWDDFSKGFLGAAENIGQWFDGLLKTMGTQLSSWAQKAWDAIKSVGSAAGRALGASPVPGFAAGGPVPGSGNGDTVPAFLTPGEFVMRRAVVDALGAPFFAALNGGMGSFLPRTRFATGGIVAPGAAGTPVHLHIGGQQFALAGASNVVSALVVEAHRQHVRSAGVKPSWYGGR